MSGERRVSLIEKVRRKHVERREGQDTNCKKQGKGRE